MSAEVTAPEAPPRPDAAAGRASAELVGAQGDGLGRLAGLAGWAAGVQGVHPPRHFRRVRAVLVAAALNVGVGGGLATADDPPQADGPEAPVLDALAAGVGATRRLVEVASLPNGSAASPSGDTAAGTSFRAFDLPELTAEEFEAAHELGRFVADEEADSGTDLLVVGTGPRSREQDIAHATALVAALLGREPVALVGTDTGLGSRTGLDDRAWTRRVVATRDALRRARAQPQATDVELLRLIGGPRIAVLTGLLQQSAVRRTPVLLDGTVSCAAGLAAERLSPWARHWWSATTTSPEPASAAALDELHLRPLLDLGLRAGDGGAALLAVPLLEAAVDAVTALAASGE
jgi:nicotinate-nucleotide--dimethylbenzimidazole phosphoribosyltransferase